MQRRHALQTLAALGVGNVVFQRALAAKVAEGQGLSVEAVRQAEWVAGIELAEEDRADLMKSFNRLHEQLETLRRYPLKEETLPALTFHVRNSEAAGSPPTEDLATDIGAEDVIVKRPENRDEMAFLSVRELGHLLRSGATTSVELTKLYLRRLKSHGGALHCVVNLTEDLALEQAERADAELAAGKDRGPLHGIPWGAKDLIAYPGYPTTWGIPQRKERMVEGRATVAKRLDEAGAVLVAKLSLGALAMGDLWYEGRTRNPWNPEEGSSGSSAGSAAATAAGLVGFSIGSETLGSIVSPSRRCGTTGLRPTFGRVSRHGCMALSWSMDKIGPITRSAEDAALVLEAIHGPDGADPSAVSASPFRWPPSSEDGDRSPHRLGIVEGETGESKETLEVLRRLGYALVPVSLPEGFPVWEMMIILTAEAATAFHDATRDGVTEGFNTWPNEFRRGHFISAVDYLRTQQIRTELMAAMNEMFEEHEIDVLVGGGANELGISNLTGHPCVVMPNGWTERRDRRVPGSLTMTGRLFGEVRLLEVAKAFQEATGYHRERPPGMLQ